MNANQPVGHLPASDREVLRDLGIEIADTYGIPQQGCRFLGTALLDNGARVGISVFNRAGFLFHFRIRFFRSAVQVETRGTDLGAVWAHVEALARGRVVRINPEIISVHEVPFIDFLNGAPGEAGQWLLGVERNGQVLWLDGAGRSHKSPETYHGDYLTAHRAAIARMQTWIRLTGRKDFTVYMKPQFDPASHSPAG